ncbi:MAG: hypothetical protein EA401_05100 [Planctomycetota bacterium]|nr:MAG: hypothetical protein EA401_05100 [Planctomycetota bacterium]
MMTLSPQSSFMYRQCLLLLVSAVLLVCLPQAGMTAEFITKPGPEVRSSTLDTTLETTAFLPAGTQSGDELSLAVYAFNGRWEAPGAPAPERMRDALLHLGLAVVMLDYQNHEKAVKPDLWQDSSRFTSRDFFRACNDVLDIETREVFVVPEGYMLRNDIHFYTSPENGLEVNAWLLYPLQADQPVPLAIRYNDSLAQNGSMLAGVEYRGFARAWIGHPYKYNRGRGIFPSGEETHEKGLAYGRSAVRTLRARAQEFHLDPDRFAIFGYSKHGNISVWVGVTSDQPAEDPKWGGKHHDHSSAVQAVVARASWGFTEFWKEDGAPKFYEWMGYTGSGEPSQEWMEERSWSNFISPATPPMALDRAHGGPWRTAQVHRHIRILDEHGVPMMQSLDSELPHHASNRDDTLHQFVEEHLQVNP